MAEQNKENKTINFAGREIDKKEFGRRVQAKLGAWMDYQGLQGDERTDFIDALNNKMNGLLSGDYTSSDFGVIQGGASNQENQYKQNGSRSDSKFSLSRRHGFNPGENVDVYLNGIAGTMDEGASTSRGSSKKATTWDKSLSAKQVTDSIFGEGNKETVAQLKLWADELDPIVNGVRSTEGRKGHIKQQLDKYIERLNNGEFDISDEDREAEIQRIGELKDALNNNNSFQLGKLAPWVSNLLFTEENYYNTPEEKQAAEQQALAKKGEDYIKNGGENPYNKETQSELWQAAEDARKAQLDQNFSNEFANYSTRSSQLRGEHWLPKWDQISNENVFDDWDYSGQYGWQHMLDALYKVNKDYSGDLGLGADLKTNFFGAGDDHTSNDSFRGIIPDAYIDQIIEPNDNLSGHQTEGSHMFRSANAYKGKFLSDYLNHFITQDKERFRVAPNTEQYLLPSMVDWSTGTAYVVTRSMNQKSKIKQVNIADMLQELRDNNPNLYNELFQDYAKFRGYKLPSAKKGGVLKAQFGTRTPEQSNFEKVEQQESEIATMGQKKFNRKNLGNQTIFDNQGTNLTTSDWMRIGAITADLTSAVSAFAPGVGTGVAAATGIGSSVTNLAADLADPSIGGWDVAKNLGINLGLDLVSLIPGVNIGATAGKIIKPLAKLAPRLIPVAMSLGIAPEFVDTLKKIGNGKNNFTANDLRVLAMGMSAIAGTSRVAGSTLKASKLNKSGYGKDFKFSTTKPNQTKTGEFPVEFVHNKSTKTSSLTADEIKSINEAGSTDAALKLFRQKIAAKTGIKEDEISFLSNVTLGKKLPFLNHKLKPAGDEILTQVDKSPEMLKFYTERFKANADYRAKHPILSKLFKTDLEMQGIVPVTNPVHFWGSDYYSPFSRGKSSMVTKAQAKMDGQPAKPNAKQKADIDNITTQRQAAQKTIKDSELTVATAKNASKKLDIYNQELTKIKSLERQLARLKKLQGKKGVNNKKNQQAIQNLEQQVNSNIKRKQTIINRINAIKKAKANNKTAEQAAENGRKQLTDLNKQQAQIDNDLRWATYNHYRDLIRRIYGLKSGGIIKANLGTQIPSKAEKPKQTSTTKPATNSSNIGTLGNPSTNIGTLGNTPETNTGTLGNPTKPSDSTFKGYDNGLNPQSHWDIPKSNLMLSLLQNEKNNLAHRTNYGILQEQLSKIPFHKDPMIYGYKVHTSKPLEDTVARIKANFNLLGSQAASGTSDLGSAFAYKLSAQKSANDQIFPYAKEQSNFVQAGEDKAREAAYQTMQSYHDTGEFNHEQDVNKYNSDRDAKSQYLSQYGNILMNDLTMRQRGLATTAKYNYQRSLLADDAMYNYKRLLNKKTNNPKDWTQDDELQLIRAYRQWNKVNRLSPIEMPYTGYQQYYTINKPFETFFN